MLVEVVGWVDVVVLFVVDEVYCQIWDIEIVFNRKLGQVLIVCYGFLVYYDLIKLFVDCDVILVVVKGLGGVVCQEFEKGKGLIGFWVVYQDVFGWV